MFLSNSEKGLFFSSGWQLLDIRKYMLHTNPCDCHHFMTSLLKSLRYWTTNTEKKYFFYDLGEDERWRYRMLSNSCSKDLGFIWINCSHYVVYSSPRMLFSIGNFKTLKKLSSLFELRCCWCTAQLYKTVFHLARFTVK